MSFGVERRSYVASSDVSLSALLFRVSGSHAACVMWDDHRIFGTIHDLGPLGGVVRDVLRFYNRNRTPPGIRVPSSERLLDRMRI